MAAIRLLPERIVNRIAAGEVIERPAAVVKELVENALDAGARRIDVSLAEGGLSAIEVADDGAGIAAADLPLAVQRHATSKLAGDDLVHIATLGFRGEALAAIGAAGRLALQSRPREAASGWEIRVEAGHVGEPAPAAAAPGTRVRVEDLFFATPARRKFLKSPRAEADAAEAALRRLAFAAAHVAFRLTLDGREALALPAQPREARIAALLGLPAETLLAVAAARETLRLSGLAAGAAAHRATGAGQAFLVNSRPVADPLLKTALRIAYRDLVPPGRHGLAALYLELPPEEVDVNVHPAKTEVRFRAPDAVRGFVISALRSALAAPARPVFVPARPRLALVPPASHPAGPPAPHPGFAEAALPLADRPALRPHPAPRPVPEHPLGAPIAQILDTYILALAADGALVLVDQHAAHERLTHETLAAELHAGGVRRQPLLLPAVVELAPAESRRLAERAADLLRLGLEIEPFGPGAVLVRALPAALGAPDPAPLLRDLAAEFAEAGEETALSARLDAAIARLACHGSIRAGRRLATEEMAALLRQIETTPRAATCSHGRPTYLKLTRPELERLFGRR